MFINQPWKQPLLYGEDSKTSCKKLDFLLATYLLRKKGGGNWLRKMSRGLIQVQSRYFCVYLCSSPLQTQQTGGPACKECSQGPLQLPLKPWDYGQWSLSGISFSGMQEKPQQSLKTNRMSLFTEKHKLCHTRLLCKIICRKLKLE